MNLSGHEDRRTLQRYLKPSKEGTHRRLDEIDAHHDTWTPSAEELAPRVATRRSPIPRIAAGHLRATRPAPAPAPAPVAARAVASDAAPGEAPAGAR